VAIRLHLIWRGDVDRSAKDSLVKTMRLNPGTLQIAFRMLIACIVGLLLTGLPVRAETYLSGTYRCSTMEVAGKTVPCKVPSLILKSDGSYKMLTEVGTYEIVRGHWLVLSASKRHSRARLDGSKQIIFTFVSGGKKSRIIYRRKYQRPEGWVAG
jgi:hypothetical protein